MDRLQLSHVRGCVCRAGPRARGREGVMSSGTLWQVDRVSALVEKTENTVRGRMKELV